MGRSRYVIGIDPPESLAQTAMIICDTNILIEFYKGNHQVVDILRGIGIPNLAISIVTTGELYYGVKDRRE